MGGANCCCSLTLSSATPWTAASQSSLFINISITILEFSQPTPIELMMPSNHFIICCTFLLLTSSLPASGSFPMSLFFGIRWSENWSFSFSISSSNEYSWLISFRIDWFDLFAIQGTLKSLLQNHNSKATVLQFFTFFMV